VTTLHSSIQGGPQADTGDDDAACIQTIGFATHRANLPDAVWVKHDFYDEQCVDARRRFSEEFGYLIRGNECFSSLKFQSEERVLLAERYGGNGIGDNGGGVRCGNWGPFQIKGIGTNPLVGRRDDVWHSYGGLNAPDAIMEAIFGSVLAQVLPCGVVSIYGVILTAIDAAYYTVEDKGWGALLVREASLRPAHFLRTPNYRGNRSAPIRVPPDAIRVRDACLALRNRFPSVRDLVKWLGVFLQRSANQFAYARVARIAHSNLSPSNLSFDGRWIDLTNATFIEGGLNRGGRPPFYEEPRAVINCLSEFADTFSKYANVRLDVGPLLNYYVSQLESYSKYWMSTLFGIAPELAVSFRSSSDYDLLVQQASIVLQSGRIVINEWPEAVSPADPVIWLQTQLFCSLRDRDRAVERLNALRQIDQRFRPDEAVHAFTRVMSMAFRNCHQNLDSFESFSHQCAIQALKHSLYAEYFYKGRLIKVVRKVLEKDPFSSGTLIDDSIGIARWVFDKPIGEVSVLFRGNACQVAFCARKGEFSIEAPWAEGKTLYPSAHAALTALASADDASFMIQGYNFKANLVRLVRNLAGVMD
jgi:hypothetical protein